MSKCQFDNGFPRGVLAIRIYFKDGEPGRTPLRRPVDDGPRCGDYPVDRAQAAQAV